MQTKLLHLSSQELSGKATVTKVLNSEGRMALILDQTLFHPQGGGQPADTGLIRSTKGKFLVDDVRIDNGQVLHWGNFESEKINPGAAIHMEINPERRLENSRLHAAGHLIDVALENIGHNWQPDRGHHHPNEAYVSYRNDMPISPDFVANLEKELAKLVQSNTKVVIKVSDDEHSTGKPLRHVTIGGKTIPCGGTHVEKLSEIGKVIIRKIKNKKGITRISYKLE